MTRATLPEHDAMVAAIVATYRAATPAQVAAGVRWYPTAGRMVAAIADSAELPQHRVAYALAALSPRNPWRWNVADAYAYAHAAAAVLAGAPDDGPPSATTFGVNRANAWRMLVREDLRIWTSAAPKVRAFVEAILGDTAAVVVDVWAIRVATAGAMERVPNGRYANVAAAYQDAARILGVAPRDAQAVTWIVAQTTGVGSNRRGRHDETFKRGTPDAVRALFAEDDPTVGHEPTTAEGY